LGYDPPHRVPNDGAFVVVHERNNNGIALILGLHNLWMKPPGVCMEGVKGDSAPANAPGLLLSRRIGDCAEAEEEKEQGRTHFESA